MKKQVLTLVLCLLATASVFAKWHKAVLYYTNGDIKKSEIHLPDETFSGIFSRVITIKSATDEDQTVSLKDINKVELTNGIVLVKYDNDGKPVLLKQVTSYPLANILVLEKHGELGSDDYWSYIYKYGNSNQFYTRLQGGSYEQNGSYQLAGNPENTFFAGYNINQPAGYYYSVVVRNGHLYTPDKGDYIYLLKDNKIERLLPTDMYAKLSAALSDDPAVAKIIKNGVGNYYQFNEVVALYNADKMAQ